MKALISVSDKTGIVEFAQSLHALGVQLLSTGGTAKLLAEKGLPVTEVAEVTKFPEMLDGRVKTLHPMVHGGLLARRELPEHMAALKEHGIETIDLLVVNLYPFEATVAKAGCTLAELAIAWVLHQGEHVIALPGTTSVEHLHEDIRGGSVKLDAELLAELDDIFKPEAIAGDRYALQGQGEVDTEKYAFEKRPA